MISTIAEIIRDLLIFVGVIAVLLIALVAVVTRMPDTNPLKRVLSALCYRLGATLAAGAIAVPIEPIPDWTLECHLRYSGIGTRFSETRVRSAPTLHHQIKRGK
jgi:hypothetical protein